MSYEHFEYHSYGHYSGFASVPFSLAALHALWDIINSLGGATLTQFVIVIIGNVVIAGISLALVIRRLREARRFLIDTAPASL